MCRRWFLLPIVAFGLAVGCGGGSAAQCILPAPASAGSGPPLDQPVSMVFDSGGGEVLLVELTLDAVIAVDIETAARRVVSGAGIGTGPTLGYPSGIALDTASARLLVADPGFGGGLSALVSVDLADGARTIISGPGIGAGTAFQDPWDVAVDVPAGRAFVVDRGLLAVVAVDLATGDRSVGPPFGDPYSVAYDAARHRLIVADLSPPSVLAVDVVTGDLTELSGPTTGSGPALQIPVQVRLAGARALVADGGLGALVAVDLVTGERAVVSGGVVGSGPPFGFPHCAVQFGNCDLALVADKDTDTLYGVDLATGSRTVISR